MLRSVAIIALLACVASAHDEKCHHLEDGTISCPWVEPKWVKHFSTPAANGGPEEIWINYGATPDSMVIGWVTADKTAASVVQYGTQSGVYTNVSTIANTTYYVYSSKYTSGLIHHVWLFGLKPATRYYYKVGQDGAWSDEYSFVSNNVGPNTYPHTIGFVADIGENDNANNTITHLLNQPSIDSMIISGDIAYASGCEAKGCTVWDAFQRMTQPLSATKPWAVNVGNHETYDVANGIVAISAKYRFSGMPTPTAYNDDGIMYFSYNVGPAHVISVSSFYPGGFSASSKLTIWLQQDLASVDRSVTPWLLVSLHAPWYNSNTVHQGDGEPMRQAYEQLFIENGVNAIFAGHVHAYERVLPTNNFKVDPVKGIPAFNIGDAGADLYTTWETKPAWSAYRSAEFGHGELQLINNTHAYWTWHRNQDDEKVVTDSYWVVNNRA